MATGGDALDQEAAQLAQEADVATIAAANRAQQIRAAEAELANLRAADAMARAEAERAMIRREEVEMDRAAVRHVEAIIPKVTSVLYGACNQMWSEHEDYDTELRNFQDRATRAWQRYMDRTEKGLQNSL